MTVFLLFGYLEWFSGWCTGHQAPLSFGEGSRAPLPTAWFKMPREAFVVAVSAAKPVVLLLNLFPNKGNREKGGHAHLASACRSISPERLLFNEAGEMLRPADAR